MRKKLISFAVLAALVLAGTSIFAVEQNTDNTALPVPTESNTEIQQKTDKQSYIDEDIDK